MKKIIKMKKVQPLIFVMVFLLSGISQAQVVLENSYDGTVLNTKTSEMGEIYYSVDGVNNQCVLYKLDHSVWKTIDLNIPENNFIFSVKYVTQHLFNNDDLVEGIVVFYEYKNINDTVGYYYYTTMIFNENGDEILTVPGGATPYIFNVGSTSSRLMIYVYDYSSQIYPVSTKVYNLPGVLLKTNKPEVSDDFSLLAPFPNPAFSEITLPFDMKAGIKSGFLMIADNTGKVINKYPIDQQQSQLRININSFKSGIYIYWTESKGYRSEPQKFIVK